MSSSDEEGEFAPEIHVSEYVFVDQNGEPISFSVLPLQWNENEVIGNSKAQVFLEGVADDGRLKIYQQVVAWRFDLSYALPEILVFSKNKKWMTLQKPRKSFVSTIRTILITIHWMHFLKKNTETPAKSVWNHLQNVFSLYEFEPSEHDLLHHKLLISEAMKRDKDLAKSKNVLNFVEVPRTNIAPHQDIPKKNNFINDGDVDDEDYNDDDIGEEVDGVRKSIFDPVCAICDDGGNVLPCEGRCLRSFHPTKAAGIDSFCESLGFVNDAQIDAIPSFLCKNCLYKQHQCYACGELGSSNNTSDQEVFPCVSATCGHFYHPKCVAKLLQTDNEAEAKKLRDKIAAGDSFTCPAHKCFACKQSEDAQVHDLQFALCRRCPKAYHRKCLPKYIHSKSICFQHDKYTKSFRRAWEDLLPYNRILIYCMEHKIVKELETPSRNHLIFPDLGVKEKKRKLELSYRGKNLASKQSDVSEVFATSRNVLKKPKLVQKAYRDTHAGGSSERTKKPCSRQEFSPLKDPNTCVTSRKFLKQNARPDFDRSLSKEKTKLTQTKGNLKVNLQSNQTGFKSKNTNQNMQAEKGESIRPLIDAQIEKGISVLIKEVDSSFNAEEFMKNQQQISGTSAYSFQSAGDKSITLGRVEASVKAVRAALQKLEAGASLEDAKNVCGPEVIKQIFKWKIVNRLHWYVQDGDTIVDFCCGSNDFSGLLKEKLEKVGKSCLFKNYDLFQPKNDFSFEKRDWMSVKPNELTDGSRLIMGLNPPFGVKASRANKFINKALTFRPKLIILIVPRETRRLDEKDAYDLIWEDDRVLSGKSFYLPGSVDVEDKHLEQWNVKAPPLYLWSRHDWTARHKAIAREQHHAYDWLEELPGNGENAKEVEFNYLMQDKHDCYGDFSKDVYACGGISSILDGVPEMNDGFESEGSRGTVHGKDMEGQFPGSNSIWKNNDFPKQIHDKVIEMQPEGHGHMDASPKAASDNGIALETDDMCIDMEISSPDNRARYYEVPGTQGGDGVFQNRGQDPLNLGFKTEYRFRDIQNPVSAPR
ncbi:protein ENHANCED DOWNY MILDEW 2 isoform X4 [Gossypium raimondii]|uniref:protein ENHANCED DOWNY MILDEW 2 isoform X4 n=1 Tax=Gossypium raimondii TaxID=29730 RepID=UPI00227B4F79|nr:protein ENHANCED DOWNY MILDEW 2 isoform X4 [Gossypium raimondii]